ncbi:MAG: hypothetical protein K6G83_04880 [Lachnospiraceae bacterium]|nr:hypothetical protein [Lachnospiraceae bacterium]
MKKKWIGRLIVGVTLSAMLAGCETVPVPDTGTQPAPETAEEAPSADEGTSEETAGEQGSYDPAAFQISDVYVAPEQEATIDISDCDTFTQIVDKLDDGMGYANVTIGDADALLVASGTFEWEPGSFAAIDAEIYIYEDGAPKYLATVSAGGTAYPLSVKDGNLYVGGNHFMSTYLIDSGFLIETEEAYVKYDTDGNATYYYRTCNSQFEDYDEATAESRFDELFADLDGVEIIAFHPVGGSTSADGTLPAYEYPGPELFYTVLYQYLTDELAKDYDTAQVSIPCPVIIAMDESDKSDIRVYGNFWIFNYDLNGETLENVSGGSYPGCIHVKNTEEGYEVIGMDIVADGSDFTDSAKEIFGSYYDAFMKDGEDEALREELRAQIIANYVAAEDLDITAYQDYGRDPVTLPEENIDNFYSKLL